MTLQFSEQAVEDLVRLREFMAQKNPKAAQRVSQRLIQSIRGLVKQPLLGHVVEEEPAVLAWVVDDYVVHYTVRDGVLTVLQIWHGKEDRTASQS